MDPYELTNIILIIILNLNYKIIQNKVTKQRPSKRNHHWNNVDLNIIIQIKFLMLPGVFSLVY